MNRLLLLCLAVVLFALPGLSLPLFVPLFFPSSKSVVQGGPGYIDQVENKNEKKPILLCKFKKSGIEYQEFGYLTKTYTSYFTDVILRDDIKVDKNEKFPYDLSYEMKKTQSKTAKWGMAGSASGSYKGVEFGADTSYESIHNSTKEEVLKVTLTADRAGMWRVATYFYYDTNEYNAYTLVWDKKKNAFVKFKDGYTVATFKPVGYCVGKQATKYFK
jgi:hypothetical protein